MNLKPHVERAVTQLDHLQASTRWDGKVVIKAWKACVAAVSKLGGHFSRIEAANAIDLTVHRKRRYQNDAMGLWQLHAPPGVWLCLSGGRMLTDFMPHCTQPSPFETVRRTSESKEKCLPKKLSTLRSTCTEPPSSFHHPCSAHPTNMAIQFRWVTSTSFTRFTVGGGGGVNHGGEHPHARKEAWAPTRG